MAKWYLRFIGIFFLLVSVPLVADYAQFGFRPETMHKIFHVVLGLIVVRYGWNDPRWWRPFALMTESTWRPIRKYSAIRLRTP